MKRLLVPLLALVFLLLAASAASAQGAAGLHVGVLGGVTMPQDDAEEVADDGWNAGALLVWNFPVVPIGIRVDGSYHKLDVSEDFAGIRDDPEILAGTANVVVGFRLLLVKPYFVGGVGYYRLDFSDDSFPDAFSGKENETGWNAGGGVSFTLRKIDIFVEARYHSVETDAGDFKFVPVSIGIVF